MNCRFIYYFIQVVIIIGSVKIEGQINKSIVLKFQDGSYRMMPQEKQELATVSRTFADDIQTGQQKLIAKELSLAEFTLIMQMVMQRSNKQALLTMLRTAGKESIEQLYELYERIRFLDISELLSFIQDELKLRITTESLPTLKKIPMRGKEQWFKDAVDATITASRVIKLKDGESTIGRSVINELAEASPVIRQELADARQGTLLLPELTRAQFNQLISLFVMRKNPSMQEAHLATASFDELCNLLLTTAFLNVKEEATVIEYALARFIQTVELSKREPFFEKIKNIVGDTGSYQAIKLLIDNLQPNAYNFIVNDGTIIKPLTAKNTVDKLIRASNFLTDYQADTNQQSSTVFYLYPLSKKGFNLIYQLIEESDTPDALMKKLSSYSLATLALLASTADYLTADAFFTPVIKTLAAKLVDKKSLARFKESDQLVTSLQLSRNTDHAVALAISDQISIRNQAYLMNTLVGHTDSVFSVAFSPGGTTLASGSYDQTIRFWDVNNNSSLEKVMNYATSVLSVAFSPDGKTIGAGLIDGIDLRDRYSGKSVHILKGHTNWLKSIAFSPKGTIIASGAFDNTVKLWDMLTGNVLKTLPLSSRVLSVAFSPDGSKIASGSFDRAITIWNVASGELLNTLTGHASWINSVAFSPDGKIIASGSQDKAIKLWSVASSTLLKTLEGHKTPVNSVAFNYDGTLLSSGSTDGKIKLWDMQRKSLFKTLKSNAYVIESVAFSPDGTILASGSGNKAIKLWRIITLNDLRDLTLDQVLLIALAHQEHQAGRSLVLTERLEAIFVSLHKPLQKLLIDVFNVRGVTT